ncbi:MAG TPA: hypothetical protein VFI31_08330 [Pirellulales bacterium]|nr:hypothetical protein [Pirellulales bacterium]
MDIRNFRSLLFGTSLFLAATGCTRPMAAGECRSRHSAAARSQRSVVETANFRIYGISRLPNAWEIGHDFERLRSALSRTWLGERRLPDWSPKCDVVVHATVANYARVVGQDQFATLGSSRVDIAEGKITLRRLDVRADQAGWFAAAVPHELTHMVMADEFLGRQLPVWADEGMAVLADTRMKQSLHLRDLQVARGKGRVFRLAQLVSEDCYPGATQIPTFYGQSVSLVGLLVKRRSPSDFVRFLHLAEKEGCDAALIEVYGFRDFADLERQWLTAATARSAHIVTVSAPGALAVHRPSDRESVTTGLVGR